MAVRDHSSAQSIEFAKQAIDKASRRGGAHERPLTDAMCGLLATDPAAARAFVNLLLEYCSAPRVREALGASELSGRVDVRGERSYSVPASLVGPRVRDRRYDLLFESDALRAVAVEVKLGSSLSDRQLDDLLVVDPVQLDLQRRTRFAVVVLGPRALELSSYARRHAHFVGAVRWSQVIDPLFGLEFADPEVEALWCDLFRIYVRRSKISSELGARPTPKLALEVVAAPLRDHVQGLVSDKRAVRLDHDAAGHVTRGRNRAARIVIVIERQRGLRSERRIVVRLAVPRGGRRQARIELIGTDAPNLGFYAPARVEELQKVLEERLTALLESRTL